MATMGSKAIVVTEPENRCPECLHLEISGEVVYKSLFAFLKNKSLLAFLKNPESEAINLFVTINFNEQWVNFSFGRVKFGLSGGELRLKLKNGKMPSKLRNKDLKKLLERELSVERQSGGEQERKSQVKGSLAPDLSKAGLEAVGEDRQKDSRSDKFQLRIAQISHTGKNNEPVWVFTNKTGEAVLLGELADSLGKMLIKNKSWVVEATFTTEMRQVIRTGLENLFKDDIFDNKLNVFELGVAKLFLKYKTQPYLSRQVLRYE